jgi:hypothetical protein
MEIRVRRAAHEEVHMTKASTDDRTWAEELDQVTRDHEGEFVTIEVLDQNYGDGEQAERVPFVYATFDPKDDVVIVAVGGRSGRFPVALRHTIADPVELDIAENALRVVAGDGTTTILAFFADPP